MPWKNDATYQAQCPNCGKFQPTDPDGFYAFLDGDDFVSVFCDEDCCDRFVSKGGKLRSNEEAA